MKTKRQKLEALMADMPQYKVVDVTKIQDEYEARYSETIAKSYVIRLYGTASERVHNNALPNSIMKKIKDLIFSVGSKRQLKRLINQVIV